VSALPAAFEEVTSGPVARVAAALADARITAYPTLGSWFVCGDAADVPALARALVEARGALPSGWIVVDDLPGAARAHVDVWGPVPPAFALMKRLKARFDPENRMNPGRFVGGL
jgi:glycolate oxidase FAD binding subunit